MGRTRKIGSPVDMLSSQLMIRLRSKKIPTPDRARTAFFAAYGLFKAKTISPDTIPTFASLLEVIGDNELMHNAVNDDVAEVWESLADLYVDCNQEDLKKYILDFKLPAPLERYSTPPSLNSLVEKLLDIKDSDTVAGFGTGAGSFIVDAYKANDEARYYNYYFENIIGAVFAVKAEVMELRKKIIHIAISRSMKQQKYSKIFYHHPIVARNLRESVLHPPGHDKYFVLMQTYSHHFRNFNFDTPNNEAILNDYSASHDDISPNPEWDRICELLPCLDGSGKAIVLCNRDIYIDESSIMMRKLFTENGYVEAIVALPDRIIIDNPNQYVLLILSRGNESTRFIDASSLCAKGRRHDEFLPEHITVITDAMSHDSEISLSVKSGDIADHSYSFEPKDYMSQPQNIPNGVSLDQVVMRKITRGAQLNSAELDQISSREPTVYQYIQLQDIQDGVLSSELPYLQSIAPRLEKYCVSPGDLLISRNSPSPRSTDPFKIAVIEDIGCQTILATGSFYIVRPDGSRIRPLYLQAFLESETGTQLLREISKGSAVPILSLELLRTLTVPCPTLEEQRKVEESYLQIKSLKAQLESARKVLRAYFQEIGQVWSIHS